MKYKIGDKVVLKIGKDFCDPAIEDVNNLPDRVATISKVIDVKKENLSSSWKFDYLLKEFHWGWMEKNIKCLVSEVEEIERWNLLDFD